MGYPVMLTLSLSGVLDDLAGQELFIGLFLCGAGLVFMIMGGRIFKSLIAVSFGVAGFVIGHLLPVSELAQIVCAFGCALALGLLSLYAVRLSLAALSGGLALLAMLGLLSQFGLDPRIELTLAGMVAVFILSLTFIMYAEVIALTTSFEGAVLFLGGLVVFLAQSQTVWGHIRGLLLENGVFLPFLILSGTVTGYYLQIAQSREEASGVSVGA